MKIIKRIFFPLIIIISFLCSNIYAANGISIYFDNNEANFTYQPVVKNDRVLVPFRALFEKLGYSISWDGETKTIVGEKDSDVLTLRISDFVAYKNGKQYYLDTPAEIIDSNTFVPLRFVAEISGVKVDWNQEKNSVNIITAKNNKSTTLEDSVVMINSNILQGSGVIISSDGYIVTNYHVLNGGKKVSVIFNDKSVYSGDVYVVDYDIQRDLAIIKIDKNNLAAAKLGDSDSIEADDTVISIGSPMGELNKRTEGKVLDFTKNVISTSAKIQHGSSGGALFNSKGELIGVNFSYSEEENYFSIPVSYVKNLKGTNKIDVSNLPDMVSTIVSPEGLSVTYDGTNTAYLDWEPIYGADYYYIYVSGKKDGKYELVKNPESNSNKWHWGFPHSFGISSTGKVEFYYKIAAVKNNVVSPLSEPVRIILK